ncbi:TPA: ATPase [Klebsiella pneumoniae]|nr:protein DpdH [Klebsiella pneumoniae]HBR0935478.1 ATPase [Klebsiella variicola]HCI6137990.1 ATPase [Klebsiella variicola subsp. variicola]MCP6556363.1 ATPase [Klebsiella pneumoniae]USB72019.1 ATPase [Klebsiella pneumoniae]HBR0937308.1 ATPase [Klebsiella variicola]
MPQLQSYWPDVENVTACILTEAESLADSQLLAVHEPMRLDRIEFHSGKVTQVRESALLEFLLEHNRPLPLIGASGVGKSHLVRWVHAQLKRREDRASYHIIRIPKNASLPRVLTSILDGLEGEEYQRIREKVNGVGQQLIPENVAEHIALKLRQALNAAFAAAPKELQRAQMGKLQLDESRIQQLKDIQQHAASTRLPALFFDSVMTEYFTVPGSCLHNIALRFCQGADNDSISNLRYEMSAEDFAFSGLNLRKVSPAVLPYLVNQQLLTSDEKKQAAARVVNEVIPQALGDTFGELFSFNRASFQELMRMIRSQLLTEGRSLILLVEDLAATSAIEDVLIDCLLEEEEYEGKKVLCTLHSIIAVTEGHDSFKRHRNTLGTRARYEWVIQQHATESDAALKKRVVDFCGRYLNAARHGAAALEKYHHQQDGQQYRDIPVWQDQEVLESESAAPVLASFGFSSAGHPLFPFNPVAVGQLVERHCRVKDQGLVYIPRNILREILREPLKNYRQSYLNGQFPPSKYESIVCNQELQLRVRVEGISQPERVNSLLAVWGGNSASLIGLNSDICREFGLPHAAALLSNDQGGDKDDDDDDDKNEDNGEVESEKDNNSEDQVIVNWKATLEKWNQGGNLEQKKALHLRKLILETLFSRIDWSTELLDISLTASSATIAGRVRLPRVLVNKQSRPLVEIEDTPELYSACLAMVRFDYYQSWTYEGSEIDYAAYHSFFDGIESEFKLNVLNEEREELVSIVKDLQLCGAFLGQDGLSSPVSTTLVQALLTEQQPAGNSHPLLDDFLTQARAAVINDHQKLRERLIALTAAKKNRGQPYAINGLMLVEAAKSHQVAVGKRPGKIHEVKNKLGDYRSMLLKAQMDITERLSDGKSSSLATINICDIMKEIVELANSADVVRPVGETVPVLLKLLKGWKEPELKNQIRQLEKLTLPADNPQVLMREILAVNGKQYEAFRLLLEAWSKFEDATGSYLQQRHRDEGGDQIEGAENEVAQTLTRLAEQLTLLENNLA